MTDGIGRINIGGSGYGMSGYVSQRKEKAPQEAPAEAPVIREETQVDGDQVLRFLEANAAVVNKPETSAPAVVSKEVELRVQASMERFAGIMTLIEEEFGSDIAPEVFDVAMDALL